MTELNLQNSQAIRTNAIAEAARIEATKLTDRRHRANPAPRRRLIWEVVDD